MTFTAPIGLLALLAMPAVVLLHMLHNRLPERRVAGLFLFPTPPVASEGGRRRTRLVRSPSFWLELLAAGLLSLWLSGFTFGDLLPRHVVVVVDDTASMGARGTRRLVSEHLAAIADGLGAADEVTVVQSGVVASVVVGPHATAADLRAFERNFRPTAPAHALQPAIDLGRELAGARGEIVLLTDTEPADPGEDLRVVACGVAAPNAAITGLARLSGEAGDRLQVTVAGFGEVAPFALSVFVAGHAERRVPVSLPPGAGEARIEVALPPDAGDVRVQLPGDALAIDDVAWLVPEPERPVAVCDRLPAASRAALRLDRVFAALSGFRIETDAKRAQVVLRTTPSSPERGQTEVVIAPTEGKRRGHIAPFVVDRSHPLLAGVDFDGVAWRSGSGTVDGRVLVAGGDQVLVAEQRTVLGRRLWLDLDPSAGNVVRSPAWPILFANLLDRARRDVPGVAAHNLRVGDELLCRGLGEPVQLLGPDGEVVAAAATGELAQQMQAVGVYRLHAANGRELARIAVRFVDARESDLRRVQNFDREPSAVALRDAAARLDPAPMRRLLCVLLLLVVMGDWWVLRRGQG